MTSQLRQIDEKGQILANLYRAGRINEARYLASLKRLTDRAERLLAKQS